MIQSAEDVFAATENGKVPNLLYLEGHRKSGSRMWNHNQKQKNNTQSKDLNRPIFLKSMVADSSTSYHNKLEME